jgi:hypothetical protein
MLGLGAKKYILKAEYRLDEIIAMLHDFIDESPAKKAEVASKARDESKE